MSKLKNLYINTETCSSIRITRLDADIRVWIAPEWTDAPTELKLVKITDLHQYPLYRVINVGNHNVQFSVTAIVRQPKRYAVFHADLNDHPAGDFYTHFARVSCEVQTRNSATGEIAFTGDCSSYGLDGKDLAEVLGIKIPKH